MSPEDMRRVRDAMDEMERQSRQPPGVTTREVQVWWERDLDQLAALLAEEGKADWWEAVSQWRAANRLFVVGTSTPR